VFGTDIDRDFPRAKRHIGVVPQEFNFNNFEKVGDILATQAGYYGLPLTLARERAEKYLHRLELWDKRASAARTLSGGMKRRLMIARALVHEPRLLILDEPTAGVDIELRRSMWSFLQELNAAGTTIILTTHYLEEAESLCRNIAIIDGGRIIENTGVKQLLRRMQVETFVLDLGADVGEGFALDGYATRVVDVRTLEVTVQKGQSLNEVFALLSAAGLPVVSMRNKTNRLEELFVGLLHKNKAEVAA
jgi:ABC-2 type transport system ATP-binding protein